MKPFKHLDEQIATLHGRGLKFDNYKKAKKFLLTNNYYNIINGYSKYFYDTNSPHQDTYINGATFDEISHTYFFDKEFKYTLFKSMIEAEGHIKHILAHKFASKYKDKPYAYLDIHSYDPAKTLKVGKLISDFSRIINYNYSLKSSNQIKHYVNQHHDVPIWVLINYLDFGTTRTLLESLPNDLKNEVARNMCSFISDHKSIKNQFTPEIMESFIKNINQTRNVCAHNNKLLDYQCKSDMRFYPDIHNAYGISNAARRRDVYNTFLVLQCFLSKVQYAQLHNTIHKRICNLDNKLSSISINIILQSLGFPDDWHINTPRLPQ